MLYDERSKLIGDLNDVKTIVKHVDELFFEHWKKTVSYGLHRLKELESKKILIPASLNKVLLYAKALNDSIDIHSEINEKVQKKVLNEVVKMEEESGYCIHMCILVKTLMDNIDPKESKKIQYYQGFSTLITEDRFASMIFGDKQVGIHAWLTYENAVVDVTAIQHKHSITLPKNKYGMIIGEMPKSYLLKGFKESEAIVVEYQDMFAKAMNYSREEWIKFHLEAFEDFYK